MVTVCVKISQMLSLLKTVEVIVILHLIFYPRWPYHLYRLFVAIPMGVYAYQAADWSVDVRNSTIFGYVTKITLGSPREIIPFLDNYATCYRIR